MKKPQSRINISVEAKIGKRVRAAREAVGMSQTDVARSFSIPVTFQQIQKIEHGTNRLSLSRAIELVKITGKPLSYFAGD